VLVFDTTSGDANGDGYYTVKIDGYENQTDLDNDIDAIIAWLIANDANIDADTVLLGAQLKGGSVGNADGSYDDFWAADGDASYSIVDVETNKPNDGDAYGEIKSITSPTGHWTRYEYERYDDPNDDFRDYHEAERVWVGLEHGFGDPQQSLHAAVSVRGQIEDASSLGGDEPWHLLGDSTRSNPAIDDGRTTSVVAALDMAWHGLQTWFEGSLEYEAAREWLDGEFEFDRVTLEGDWAMQALADHTLEIGFFMQQPLGDPLPRQRWSFLGGPGTLQTVEFARYSGDRVVFVETQYWIPVPDRWYVPFLGTPALGLVHGTGMAWVEGEDRSLEQEVGVRLRFLSLEFRFMLDPTDPSSSNLDIGVSVALGGSYPWQIP
jgi:hypothetical protein